MQRFELISEYRPSGDQPAAIEALVNGVNLGLREQTLLGVTGVTLKAARSRIYIPEMSNDDLQEFLSFLTIVKAAFVSA